MPGCSSRARICRSAWKRSSCVARLAAQQLERDALREAAVGALGVVDLAHAAAADAGRRSATGPMRWPRPERRRGRQRVRSAAGWAGTARNRPQALPRRATGSRPRPGREDRRGRDGPGQPGGRPPADRAGCPARSRPAPVEPPTRTWSSSCARTVPEGRRRERKRQGQVRAGFDEGAASAAPHFLFCFSVFFGLALSAGAAVTTGAAATSSTSSACTLAETITGFGLPWVTTLTPSPSLTSLTCRDWPLVSSPRSTVMNSGSCEARHGCGAR